MKTVELTNQVFGENQNTSLDSCSNLYMLDSHRILDRIHKNLEAHSKKNLDHKDHKWDNKDPDRVELKFRISALHPFLATSTNVAHYLESVNIYEST